MFKRLSAAEINLSPAIPDKFIQIIRDSASADTPFNSDEVVADWLMKARRFSTQKSEIMPLADMDGWKIDPISGNIEHSTGRFFSIIGLRVRHRIDREELLWEQPMIDQPEVGILGIVARNINGVLHFALQAKEEPGNIGGIQLSPTVQATYSNYTAAHGGASPSFLTLFTGVKADKIIFARLQTEDGGRFIYKSNRNMIVYADESEIAVELPQNFIWLTLKQVSKLIQNNEMTVNACARSILSALLFVCKSGSDNLAVDMDRFRKTTNWIDERKSLNHLLLRRIPLKNLQEWHIDDKGFFSHKEQRFFSIIGLNVSTGSREIKSWHQPIIKNPAAGIIGLLLRKGENGIEILMQAKAEAGNRGTIQLAPTVQFTQSNYEGSQKLTKPFLYNEFLLEKNYSLIHESRQTEEGARFYLEYHLHRILMLPSFEQLEIPADYRWLSIAEIIFMLHYGDQVNSCARSILSCLL